MNDTAILLSVFNQFGIKPTKHELLRNLVENYGMELPVAKQLVFTCLRTQLITMDSLVHRISITQKGLDWLQNQEEEDRLRDSTTNTNTQIKAGRYTLNGMWKKYRNWLSSLLIGLLILLLSIIAHIYGWL